MTALHSKSMKCSLTDRFGNPVMIQISNEVTGKFHIICGQYDLWGDAQELIEIIMELSSDPECKHAIKKDHANGNG